MDKIDHRLRRFGYLVEKTLEKSISGGPCCLPVADPVYQWPAKFVDQQDISEDWAFREFSSSLKRPHW